MEDVRHEPSMEEILASIRKIIAQDSETALQSWRARRTAGEGDHEPDERGRDDVLELNDPAQPLPPAEPLVSSDAAETSRQALAALSGLVVRPPADSDNTLEGLVREMLRPMLRQWLDANLPQLVETLVAREIVRLTTPKS